MGAYIILEEVFPGGWKGYMYHLCSKIGNSREEGVLDDNKSLCGAGMDIFWNHMYTLNFHTIQIYHIN